MGRNVDPQEIFDKFGDIEYLKMLIVDAYDAPSTAGAHQIRVASMLYLAENLRRNGVASQEHASRLTFATWALVAATVMLAVVALLQLGGVG